MKELAKTHKVVRFMGHREALKLLAGQTVSNSTDHKGAGAKTDSVGFCFTPLKETLYANAKYLSGITTMDVALVAEIDASTVGKDFKKGYGLYAPPMKDPETPVEMLNQIVTMLSEILEDTIEEEDMLRLDEYSTRNYSLDSFTKWAMYVGNDPDKEDSFYQYDKATATRIHKSGSMQWEGTAPLIAGEAML